MSHDPVGKYTSRFCHWALFVSVVEVVMMVSSFAANAADTKPKPDITQKVGPGGKGIIQTGDRSTVHIHNEGISQEMYDKKAIELGITQAAVKNFLEIMGQQQVPSEKLDATLHAMAAQYKVLDAELAMFKSEDPEVAELKRKAKVALNEGDFKQVESLLEQAFTADSKAAAMQEEARDQRLRSAAASAYELGNLKYMQIAYADASRDFRKAVDTLPAKDDIKRAEYLTFVGNTALDAGLYPEAQKAHEEALTIRKKALGPEHTDTATSLNNLAALYYTQGQYEQARSLYKRSLAILEKSLGPDHPDVAKSLNNLASLYQTQGQYEQAEPLYKRSLAIKEKVLGPDHPDVATSLNNIAGLHYRQGHYEQAEPLINRSLAIDEKAYGPNHPDVALNLNNLAKLYSTQGQYEQAEPLYKRSLVIFENALGPEHHNTAMARKNLLLLHRAQEREAEAKALKPEAAPSGK